MLEKTSIQAKKCLRKQAISGFSQAFFGFSQANYLRIRFLNV
jgi:hypothetical protein